jgi:hypothetical protein
MVDIFLTYRRKRAAIGKSTFVNQKPRQKLTSNRVVSSRHARATIRVSPAHSLLPFFFI